MWARESAFRICVRCALATVRRPTRVCASCARRMAPATPSPPATSSPPAADELAVMRAALLDPEPETSVDDGDWNAERGP